MNENGQPELPDASLIYTGTQPLWLWMGHISRRYDIQRMRKSAGRSKSYCDGTADTVATSGISAMRSADWFL